MARGENKPEFVIKYPYSREELGEILNGVFEDAIKARDFAQEASSQILKIKAALDKGYLRSLEKQGAA